MSDTQDEKLRSFRLSRGPSDLGTLFFAFAFGAVLLISPPAARWIMRALTVVYLALLFQIILSVRRLRRHAPPPPSAPDRSGTIVALAVLAVWVWVIARSFSAGLWLDATLIALVIAEFVYLEALKSRRL